MDSSSKFSIPQGWLACPNASCLIANSFVVCKTMLGEAYDDKVPSELRFNWSSLKEHSLKTFKRSVGLVIDLTNTNRFYDKSDIENEGVSYVKIACKGFDECPSLKSVNEFVFVIQSFLNQSPDGLVCVHCTHGFNRSGFMVISYLCNALKFDLGTAVDIFAISRSPGIYKADYLSELSMRYGSGEKLIPPPLPDWHEKEKQKAPSPVSKRQKQFMDGSIPSVDHVSDIKTIEEVQSIVASICGWKKGRFPGSQPVSMDVNNIKKLTASKYGVTWKADGQRYLMLIRGEKKIYMIDRDCAVYKVSHISFPRRKAPHEHITDTLLDGEMVVDKLPTYSRGRYLVYDIIRFEGQEVCKTLFDIRLLCISKEIIQPREAKAASGLLDKSKEPFSIKDKGFWNLTKAMTILEEDFRKQIFHDTDGLIFQPFDGTYVFGQCDEILKWKPPELNSIDFLLVNGKKDGRRIGHLMVTGMKIPYSTIELTEDLCQYVDKIIECTWDNQKKIWKFMRERTDKSFPNSLKTADAVNSTITNPVTKEHLCHVIDTQRFDLAHLKPVRENSSTCSNGNPQNAPRQSHPPVPSSNVPLPLPHLPSSPFTSAKCRDPFGLYREVQSLLERYRSAQNRPKASTKNYPVNNYQKRRHDHFQKNEQNGLPVQRPSKRTKWN